MKMNDRPGTSGRNTEGEEEIDFKKARIEAKEIVVDGRSDNPGGAVIGSDTKGKNLIFLKNRLYSAYTMFA